MTSTSRNYTIDNIKAFAIILVVLGHSIQYNNSDFDNVYLFRIIYSFHMPLFMFISGYCSGERKRVNIIKRAKVLLFPFVIWTLINSFFQQDSIGTYLKNVILYPDYSLWFLWVLFLCNIILYGAQRATTKYAGIICLVLSFIIPEIHLHTFGIGLLKGQFLFFTLGFIAYRLRKKYNYINIKLNPWIIFISLLALFFSLSFFWHRLNSISEINWISQLYRYTTALSGIGAFCYLFKFLKSDIINKIGIKIGRRTLQIYAMHACILSSIIVSLNVLHLPFILNTITTFIVTLSSTYIIILCIEKIPLLNKILFYYPTQISSQK